MKNTILLGLFLFFGVTVVAQENQIQVSSKISKVTVFMTGAQVQREMENFDIPQGVSLLVCSGLSSAIEQQSIQAKGEGNFTILSVSKQANFLFEKKNSELKTSYITTISNLTDQMESLRNESEVYKADEEMLLKNNTIMGPNVNYDLAKLKLALDFQKQRLTEAKSKQIDINKQISALQKEIQRYQKQLNEINGKTLQQANDIIVKISAKTATKGKLFLNYMVNNASWYPSYDIRAKDISSPIELVYKANVSQNSGEDWKNIKLTLSSGNPSTNGVKPDLSPYSLGFLSAGYTNYNPSSSNVSMVKGRVFDTNDQLAIPGVNVRVKNTSIVTTTDENGNYTLQVPQGAKLLVFSYLGYKTQEVFIQNYPVNVGLQADQNSLNEVAVSAGGLQVKRRDSSYALAKLKTEVVEVNSVQKQTNVVFEIKNPYTILSDGKQFSVDIGNYDFTADYEYYTAPKISEEAFLTAKINGFAEANLIAGEANIFFEGTYLGKTLLDVQNSADTLTISLGVDKNVIIKREKQKDFNEKQFIGSSQKDSRSFIIDIKNRKSQLVKLIVEDQLPISTSSDITVDRQEISKAKYDEATGKLTWSLVLQPNEQQKLALKYQVKYPKNKPINLE